MQARAHGRTQQIRDKIEKKKKVKMKRNKVIRKQFEINNIGIHLRKRNPWRTFVVQIATHVFMEQIFRHVVRTHLTPHLTPAKTFISN
jgi:hypothetical protein